MASINKENKYDDEYTCDNCDKIFYADFNTLGERTDMDYEGNWIYWNTCICPHCNEETRV